MGYFNAPSIKRLMELLNIDKYKAIAIRAIIKNCQPTYTDIDKALEAIDDLLNYSGVESIRQENLWIDYYLDIRYLYCNSGDSYAYTILFDTENFRFVLSCTGYLVEHNNHLI